MLAFNESAEFCARATLQAIEQSLAIIEFDPGGRIINANDKFCSMIGFFLPEIAGEHHSIFVEPVYRSTPEYQYFWTLLARGDLTAREFRFVDKQGAQLWLHASYNPVRDRNGIVTRIVSVVTDMTKTKLKMIDMENKFGALSRVQAIAEFSLSGEIIAANENFLHTLGYSLDEIRGQHHRILVEPSYAKSIEYERFWQALADGNYIAASFKRISKGGQEVWIQASYNPVLDNNQKILKIVQFASVILLRTPRGFHAWPITI